MKEFEAGDPIIYEESSLSGPIFYEGEILFIAGISDFSGKQIMIKYIDEVSERPSMHYILVTENQIKLKRDKYNLEKGDKIECSYEILIIKGTAYCEKDEKMYYLTKSLENGEVGVFNPEDIQEVIYD